MAVTSMPDFSLGICDENPKFLLKVQQRSFSENSSPVLCSNMEFINRTNEIKALLDYLSAPLFLSRVLLFLWLWNEKNLPKLDIFNSLENMKMLSKIS